MFLGYGNKRGQIALEFLIVYSFILIVFILLFSIITTQRTVALTQQEQSLIQLQAQNMASYITQAAVIGDGYNATLPLLSGISNYNISISNTGVVIVRTKVGGQVLTAYGFGNVEHVAVSGTKISPNIYQISTSQGKIHIVNVHGTIYVAYANPPQTVGFGIVTPYVVQFANVRAASFNDTYNSEIIIPASQALTLNQNFTISFWFLADPKRQHCGTIIGNNAISPGKFEINIGTGCRPGSHLADNRLVFNVYTDTGVFNAISSFFPAQTWMHGVAVVKSSKPDAFAYLYLNGSYSGELFYAGNIVSTDTNTLYIGGGGSFFNGSVADVQIYNGILSASQVLALYNSGIGGGPISSNIIGWWPLNNNLNDYSGYNNQGTYTNFTNGFPGLGYSDVILQTVKFIWVTGKLLAGKVVGVETSLGVLGQSGSSFVTTTDNNGLINYFITENGTLTSRQTQIGRGVVALDYFFSKTQPPNVIGWWPLDLGRQIIPGSYVVYDLSGHYDNGNFSGAWKIVKPKSGTQLISAVFPGDPTSVANSNTQDGFITVNSSSSLLNAAKNDSFTLVAWIKSAGIGEILHSQGIFGNWNGAGGGFQLEAYSACPSISSLCSGTPVLEVSGNTVNFPSAGPYTQSLPANNLWEMVTAEYNGTTGLATVYLNNTVFASNMLPKQLSLTQQPPGNYYIGDDASTPNGLDTYNGSIADVQLYSTNLNLNQISYLYGYGIASIPLGNSGLISWWPLANNTRDYSYNNNKGAVNYNVLFTNSTFNTYWAPNETFSHATFNGSYESNIIIPYNAGIVPGNSFSVSFQFLSFNGYTNNVNFDLFNSTNNGGSGDDTLDIRLCGTGSACGNVVGLNSSIGDGNGHWLSANVNAELNFLSDDWYRVIETFNTTGWTVYIGTRKINSGKYSGSPPVLWEPGDYIRIGGGLKNSNAFEGQIADLRVYNSILSKLEVTNSSVQVGAQHVAYNISVG